MDPTARNGLIAFSAFFLMLFVIFTINMYDQSLNAIQNGGGGSFRGAYDGAVIRDPASVVDEIKEFKHETITKEELGNKAWTVLHLITGQYPEEPDAADKKNIEIFLKLFAQYYPCKECGSHFYKMLQDYPVQANSREELMKYLCALHNKVNKRLHKPEFNCDIVKNRWSDCGCDSNADVDS